MDWLNFLKEGLGLGTSVSTSPGREMPRAFVEEDPDTEDTLPSWSVWRDNPTASRAFLWESEDAEWVVKLTPHPRARRLKLRMKSRDDIRLTVPVCFRVDEVERFLRETESWVKKHQAQMAPAKVDVTWHHGMMLPYRGAERALCCASVNDWTLTDPSSLYLKLARTAGPADIRDAVERHLKAQALVRLHEVVDALQKDLVIKPKALKVTSATTRWGACTWDNVIRVSWRLLFLDDDLFRTVVVHECAHLRFKHHQAAFWEECVRLDPQHMAHDARLRRVAMMSLPL